MLDIEIHIILFFVFSFLLVASSLGVVINKNPIKSALFLVVFFVSLSAMFALLGAHFMATLQVLVYVGAIMVLFLFVIMLLAVRDKNFKNMRTNWVKSFTVFLLFVAFCFQFLVLSGLLNSNFIQQKVNIQKKYQHTEFVASNQKTEIIEGNTEVISFHLFKKHLLPFEIISIILLVAVVGSVMLAKKDRRQLEE